MRSLLLLLSLFSIFHLNAQVGGNTYFSFLDKAFNARSLSLGSNVLSVKDGDLNLGLNNPALLNMDMQNKLVCNQLFQSGGVQYGMIAKAKEVKILQGMGSMAFSYQNYGKMIQTKETGEIIGDFTPGDFVLSAGFSKALNSHFDLGIQMKTIYAQYANYSSFGLGFDFGASYLSKDELIRSSILIKNIGYTLKGFTPNDRGALPANFLASFTHKLKHAPIRFSYLFHSLNRWDLSYTEPITNLKTDPLTGDTLLPNKATIIQKGFMHFTPQVELLFSKNFHIRFAYDYFKREQLKLISRPGLAGFSFGIGMYFNRFSLDYGVLINSVAGTNQGVTLSIYLDKWRKRLK
jgi:hypothetical protein